MILSLIGLGGITLLLATSYPDGMKGMYGLVLIFGFLSGCGIATFSAGIGQTSYWFPRQKQGLSDENSTIRARELGQELFRHLVISRIAFPLSKLKTIDYIYLYQGVSLEIDAVYLFLDKLNSRLKDQVEQIAFAHTLSVPEGKISVVFYDMTTLYFEASDEDDLLRPASPRMASINNLRSSSGCWLAWAAMPLGMISTRAILMKVIHLSLFLRR